MAQNLKESFEKAPYINGIFGTYNRSQMIENIINKTQYVLDVRMDKYEFLPPTVDYQFPLKRQSQ